MSGSLWQRGASHEVEGLKRPRASPPDLTPRSRAPTAQIRWSPSASCRIIQVMKRSFLNISIHTRAHQIAIATIVASVLYGLMAQSGSFGLLFSPVRTLFHFELWRPFTALFVATSPLEVIFGALIIYGIGGVLERRWRNKRFIAVTLGIPLVAEVCLLALSFAAPRNFMEEFAGSRLVVITMWVVYGLAAHFSHEMINFWGNPITGKTFALIGVGFVVLTGAFNGFLPVLPDLITIGLCYLYMYRYRVLNLKRSIELRYYDWKLQRLKSKSNLRVIKGHRDGRDDDDENDPGHQIH